MQVKEKIYNLLNVLKKSIEKFPITIVSILILTLIFTVCIDNKGIDWDIIGRVTLCIAIFSSTTYLIETLVENKKKYFVYYILAIIWAGLLTFFAFTQVDILGIKNDLFVHFIVRIISCYILSVSILSIYFNCKKSEKTFEDYLTNVVVSIFKVSLIYGILAIGSAIIVAIFNYLILNGKQYSLIGRVEILLLGIYYLPTIIYSFYKQDNEIGKFAKIVIRYVLGTLVMIAFAIIYIYILKILILRDIPSNQIFRILAALFAIGLPIWTMCMSMDEGKTFDKIYKKLPYLFIPFILLQMYSIGVRIGTNGLTEARYLCVVLIIFEIIYTMVYIKNKSKIEINLLIIMALIIISTIAPFINMFKLSALNQFNILKTYDQKENLSKEENNKLDGAYYFLRSSTIGKQYLENYKMKNEPYSEYSIDLYEDKSIYISARRKSNYLKIEGYKKLYEINANNYGLRLINNSNEYRGKEIDKIFEKINFEINESKDTIDVNMVDLVKMYIQMGDSLDRSFDNVNEIVIDSNKKIILDSFYISYNESTNEVENYSIDGYLLEK